MLLREPGDRNRQQGAAQTISDRLHWLIRATSAHLLQGLQQAHLHIRIHAEVAIFCIRIAP